jgi:hypothetical protein
VICNVDYRYGWRMSIETALSKSMVSGSALEMQRAGYGASGISNTYTGNWHRFHSSAYNGEHMTEKPV